MLYHYVREERHALHSINLFHTESLSGTTTMSSDNITHIALHEEEKNILLNIIILPLKIGFHLDRLHARQMPDYDWT